MLTSMSCVTTEGHVDVYRPCCCQGLYWSEWPAVPLENMLISRSRLPPRAISGSIVLLHLEALSVICFISRNSVKGHDVCSLWLWRTRKLLLLWYEWLTTDAQLRGRETGGIVITLHHHHTTKEGNGIDRKPLKRTLKSVKETVKCGSLWLMASGRYMGGEVSDLFKEGYWDLDHAPVSM